MITNRTILKKIKSYVSYTVIFLALKKWFDFEIKAVCWRLNKPYVLTVAVTEPSDKTRHINSIDY